MIYYYCPPKIHKNPQIFPAHYLSQISTQRKKPEIFFRDLDPLSFPPLKRKGLQDEKEQHQEKKGLRAYSGQID